MRVNKLLFAGLVFVLAGCMGKKYGDLPLSEFMNVIEQKQTGIFSKTIENINYILQYKPLDYVMIREMNEDINDEKKFKTLKKEYGKFDYYTLEISIEDFKEEILKYNLKTDGEYSERVEYYAFRFQNDLKMVQEKDTFPCAAYHFERNYGLSPKVRFLLAFKRGDDSKERTFICHESYLGNSTVKINIDPNSLKEIPTLKMR